MTGPAFHFGSEHGFRYVGPPDDRLYRVGSCRVCEISIWSHTPAAKVMRGDPECEQAMQAKREEPHEALDEHRVR